MNIKRVAILYGQFVGSSNGRPPKDVGEFRKFVEKNKTQIGGPGDITGDILLSPRDGKPYGIPCGADAQKTAASGLAVYEQEGVDGRRMVAYTIGMVEEVDDARLQEMLSGKARTQE